MFLHNARRLTMPLIYTSLALTTTLAHANCINWPKSTFEPTPNAKTGQIAPDYGLYFFKHQDNKTTAMRAFSPPNLIPQFANGKRNTLPKGESQQSAKQAYLLQLERAGYFDPKKPTLIFIHGDQATFTKKRKRVDFCYQYKLSDGKLTQLKNTQKNWSKWNVAAFYWNQFADDVQGTGIRDIIRAITYPEMKIYSSMNAAGMRWAYLDQDGKQHFCYQGKKGCINLPKAANGRPLSVTSLAYLSYINAFPKGYTQPIRLVGQSLGAQLAIQLTQRVTAHPQLPQPTQLTLVDPYFSPRFHRVDVKWNKSDSVADYNYKTMKHVLAANKKLGFAIFRTTHLSTFPLGARNPELEKLSAYQRICPAYLSSVDKHQRVPTEHLSAAYVYFHSMGIPTAKGAISATTSNHMLRNLAGTRRYCTITKFSSGCQGISSKPIACLLERHHADIK